MRDGTSLLVGAVERLGISIKEQFSSISGGGVRHGVNGKTLPLLIGIIGLGSAIVSPILMLQNQQGNKLDTLADRLATDIRMVQKDSDSSLKSLNQGKLDNAAGVVALQEKSREIETQFKWLWDVVNLEHQAIERTQMNLWSKAYPELPYPNRAYWPGPIGGSGSQGPTAGGGS
jgi:hypothetical protein